jgi:hypothetical protein
MSADYDDNQIIAAAWRHPRMAEWIPSEKNPTARITIRPKAPAQPSGLILPPSLREPVDSGPAFMVEFQVEFGMVEGKPAFQIIGTCNGTKMIVHQGYCKTGPS